MTRLRRLLAAATLVVAAVSVAGVPSTAQAAACATSAGVTVVVDYNDLGGGVQQVCRADGGGDRASDLYPAAGFPITYVQRQPGFVCRVTGLPDDDPCVNTPPADAYWALWWSDGTDGTWHYSTLGVGSLRIPDGGYVALVWDDQDGDARPSSAAAVHPAATAKPPPAPSTRPTGRATGRATTRPSAGGISQPSSPTATVTSTTTLSASGSPTPTGTPTPTTGTTDASDASDASDPGSTPAAASSSAAPNPATDASSAQDGGLPVWLAPALIVVLAALGGGAFLARRGR